MAMGSGVVEKLKQTLAAEIRDEEKWAANMRLFRALSMFAGSIVLMRNFGDLFAV